MAKPTRFTGSLSNLPHKDVTRSTVEFDTQDMQLFVKSHALDVEWERSYLCTCRSPMTQAPDPLCHICRGRGIAYLPASTEQVMIQSQQRGVFNGDLGLYDSGTAMGTTRLESAITFRDRLTVPDVSIHQSMIFDVNDYRVKNGMYLSYDVRALELVIGAQGRELVEGQDYTFDESSNMFYPTEELRGTNVSINMEVTLRYIVIDLLKESRYQYTRFALPKAQFENLPRLLLLKREDIFVDAEPFSLTVDTTERLKELEAEEAPPMVDPKRKGSLGGFFGGKLNG